MDDKTQIKEILTRLERLEKVVLTRAKEKIAVVAKKENFSGAKGGLLLLVSKGYFSQRRSATEVKSELMKNEYDYSIQVVQTALNRLAKGKGELVAMKSEGKKVYVKRK
jgi:hypothetical protein